jgi:amino acid adenylation domain-containing protein
LLGILKAGGAYVPLDPSYPVERLKYMLADSAPRAALSHGPARAVLAAAAQDLPRALSIIDLDADAKELTEQPTENLDPRMIGLTSEHLAYVIYTSGSTGRPKGIVVTHAPVINLISWVNETFEVCANDALLFVTSICFDLSVYDIFGVLAAGAKIRIADEQMINDPQRLARIVCDEGITFWDSAPAALQLLVPYLKERSSHRASLRLVFNSGDWIPLSLPSALVSSFPEVRFIALGGATEATVWSNWYEVREVKPEWKSIPYGRPIQNVRYYVLDSALQPGPIGVAGDLYIAGECLANGYTDASLTSERFIASPFVSGDRLYKTGDRARFYAGGNIEFLGRTDSQVKIRGYRIELGEIEAQLRACEGVREAVVIVREDGPGDKRLVAYYIANAHADDSSPAEPGAQTPIQVLPKVLRTNLLEVLPEYMVPAAYVELRVLPLTHNGKLDRNSLPIPGESAYTRLAHDVPRGAVETLVAEIWCDLLNVDRVGRCDNFFVLGGHSLLAMRMLDRMRQIGLHSDVKTLFLAPTLGELAALVGQEGALISVPPNLITMECNRITPELLPLVQLSQVEIDQVVERVPGGVSNVQDIYRLTPLQEGILFHHRMAQGRDPYLLWTLMSFEDRAKLDAYVRALNAVIDRHDILRTAVIWEGFYEPVQVVWRQAPLVVEEVILGRTEGDVVEQFKQGLATRIEISRAPMMRFLIARDCLRNRWLGALLSHHLALDHTTIELVNVEVRMLMAGQEQGLSEVLPFRCLVAQIQQSFARHEYSAFFRHMLEEVEEPTAPFGLMEVRGDGTQIVDTARGERSKPLPCGVGAVAVAYVRTGRSGIRHGSVRTHAWE